MDGHRRWIDNRMIERLWRSLKYECVYIQAFETGSGALREIGKWLSYYSTERPHSRHGILTLMRSMRLKRHRDNWQQFKVKLKYFNVCATMCQQPCPDAKAPLPKKSRFQTACKA